MFYSLCAALRSPALVLPSATHAHGSKVSSSAKRPRCYEGLSDIQGWRFITIFDQPFGIRIVRKVDFLGAHYCGAGADSGFSGGGGTVIVGTLAHRKYGPMLA